MNQSCRPGLGAEIQCRAGRQRKAQGPLTLHLSPMGCKWYADLGMRAASKPRAGPLLRDEFQPRFLTSWTQACSNGSRSTEQRLRVLLVCACLRRCPPAAALAQELLVA